MLPLTSDWTIRWRLFATELRRRNKSMREPLHSSSIERVSQAISSVFSSYLRGRDLPKIEGLGNWRGLLIFGGVFGETRISTPIIKSVFTSAKGRFMGRKKCREAFGSRFQYNPFLKPSFRHESRTNVNHYFVAFLSRFSQNKPWSDITGPVKEMNYFGLFCFSCSSCWQIHLLGKCWWICPLECSRMVFSPSALCRPTRSL